MLLKFCLCVRLCCSTFQVGGVLKGGRFLLQRPSGAVPEWLMLESSMFLTRKVCLPALGDPWNAVDPWTQVLAQASFLDAEIHRIAMAVRQYATGSVRKHWLRSCTWMI
eukprot:g3434.t2